MTNAHPNIINVSLLIDALKRINIGIHKRIINAKKIEDFLIPILFNAAYITSSVPIEVRMFIIRRGLVE